MRLRRKTPKSLKQLIEGIPSINVVYGRDDITVEDVITLEVCLKGWFAEGDRYVLTFVESLKGNKRILEGLAEVKGVVVLIPAADIKQVKSYFSENAVDGITVIAADMPVRLALAMLLDRLYPLDFVTSGVSEGAWVSPSAHIDDTAWIGPFAYVGENAYVGARCRIFPFAYIGNNVKIDEETVIYPGVVILDDCRIGRRCIIHAGAVIGADGFGFVFDGNRHVKIPQVGSVVIEDEVEIGACTCVDRATLGETRVGKGTKVDNLVQIAHNVKVGGHTVIAAQTGIAGSSSIGNYCMIGGQVGIRDHVSIGDNIMLGARTAVNTSLNEPGAYIGEPAMPYRKAMHVLAVLRRLPELEEKVKCLEEKLESIQQKLNK